MSKDFTQLEMFPLDEEKKKKEKRHMPLHRDIAISWHVMIYIILGLLLLLAAIYIAGVETGRNWKVDKIYREYIKEKKVE
jgi:hypothetical protein